MVILAARNQQNFPNLDAHQLVEGFEAGVYLPR